MRVNTVAPAPALNPIVTHEGAMGATLKGLAALERTVASCLLFEDMFYESGTEIASRIVALCENVSAAELSSLAIKARSEYKLRHVPLFLALQMVRLHKGSLVAQTVASVIQRPDEMGEMLALYWREGKRPLAAQLKKGLARAFGKFNAFQLAKWDRATAIKLRDVMFLTHPKPANQEQEALWRQVAERSLTVADTWEVALSTGKDKKATWERLLAEKRLGGIALLMNLRNMCDVGVDESLISDALKAHKFERVLPFRFIAAATAAPRLEASIENAMLRALAGWKILAGRTLLVLDVSGSMTGALSAKSRLSRVDAACGLAILLREVAEEPTIYATAGNDETRVHATALIPSRHGFALRDGIKRAETALGGGGIFLVQCLDFITSKELGANFERVIVLTDEQDCDNRGRVGAAYMAKRLGRFNYVLNVAGYDPGLDVRNKWSRFSGWSERILEWIVFNERPDH